jgi:hypothetical protein
VTADRANAGYVIVVVLASILGLGLFLSWLQPVWNGLVARAQTEAAGRRYEASATEGVGYLQDLMATAPGWILLILVVFVFASTAFLSARRAA